MRLTTLALALLASSSPAAGPPTIGYHLIAGSVPLDWRGPDGNTIIFDAPDGLIVVDTGRHPSHARAILDYASSRGKPIAAIVNTHWHLDHTTGNVDVRERYPGAQVYATTAVEGALASFLGRNREQADRRLADPQTTPEQKAQILRGRHRVEHPDTLRPTLPVLRSGQVTIAGRALDVHVAPFAATEADLWLYDPDTRTAIVGDLVVDIVPFMDSACPEGWAKALDEVAATPFVTLIPGHGPAMDRARFQLWKSAFENFVSCGRSDAAAADCAAAWMSDAGTFVPPSHVQYAKEAAEYYITSRFRSPPEEQQRFCKSLLPGA